jgi:hypothetical protein
MALVYSKGSWVEGGRQAEGGMTGDKVQQRIKLRSRLAGTKDGRRAG